MKKYKLVIISLLLLVFMVGAVSAADENVTDDNLEISDEISVDEEVVASSDVDEVEEEAILQQEDADLQDILGDEPRFNPGMAELPDYPDGNIRVLEGSHKEIVAKYINKADENQGPAVNKTVGLCMINVDTDDEYPLEVETDSEGYGSFVVDVPEGYYILYIINPNNGRMKQASVGGIVVEINVLNANTPSSISVWTGSYVENFPVIVGENLTLNVRIKDPLGDPIPNSSIVYTLDNISEELNSTDGNFNLVISSLPVGAYNLSVYCPQINMTKSVGIYVLSEPAPTVSADNFTMIFGDNKEFTVKLTDDCGLPLINVNCVIQIADKRFSAPTDENGTAHFIFDTLDAGASYTATITNIMNQKKIYRTITVLANSSISVEDNVTFDCEGENNYNMSFTNVDGTPLVNGTVDVIIDDNENYHYVLTTDENGTVCVDLSTLPGGNHVITIVNPITGEKTSTTVNLLKVKTSISAAAVTTVYNGGKYVVFTLKNDKGTVLAGKSVSVVLNGKTIKGTTDKNGQFKVSTDGLAPKAYTATMTFAEDDYLIGSTATAKITVNKATPKLTAKKATFKTKTKKYTITLKDNKNKAMKKVKVTLKVKGKTYKATTNAKGKATFKLTKLTKKGKYTAKVKFAGNTYYKAVNKSVKLTVKK